MTGSSFIFGSADFPVSHTCPECGRSVSLGPALLDTTGGGDEALDRLAHALCGCYVLSMPAVGLARLLGALLHDSGENEGPAPR